jgi:hypothetical protein
LGKNTLFLEDANWRWICLAALVAVALFIAAFSPKSEQILVVDEYGKELHSIFANSQSLKSQPGSLLHITPVRCAPTSSSKGFWQQIIRPLSSMRNRNAFQPCAQGTTLLTM